MDERVWLTHPQTGGHFHCPVGAVDAWTTDAGWRVADGPPPEDNPVTAEMLAWQAAQAAAAEPKSSRKRGTDTPQEG